jgi:hypothetical protein
MAVRAALSALFLPILIVAQLPSYVKFGPGYDFPTTNEIVRTETTYTPGPMEKDIKGLTFLWPGIWNPAQRTSGDLIQTVIEGSKGGRASCSAKPGQ